MIAIVFQKIMSSFKWLKSGRKAMFSEFRAFIARGNVLDLAVGVLIGAAFGKIITSLTDDVIMPFISLITGGGVDFSSKYVVLGGAEKVTAGMSLVAAKAAGVALSLPSSTS
jgi:large conductance mechanosensitive channel